MEQKEFYDKLNKVLIPSFLKEIEAASIDSANAETIPIFLEKAIKDCNFRQKSSVRFKAFVDNLQ